MEVLVVKIGIIGAGNMGTLHASLIARGGRGEVAAVYDQDAARAGALAKAHGARACGGVEELFGAGLDMVFIAVPNTQHAPLAQKALERGLDVFVEKTPSLRAWTTPRPRSPRSERAASASSWA